MGDYQDFGLSGAIADDGYNTTQSLGSEVLDPALAAILGETQSSDLFAYPLDASLYNFTDGTGHLNDEIKAGVSTAKWWGS
jgi:hypothetical protein